MMPWRGSCERLRGRAMSHDGGCWRDLLKVVNSYFENPSRWDSQPGPTRGQVARRLSDHGWSAWPSHTRLVSEFATIMPRPSAHTTPAARPTHHLEAVA